ncbi:MAG: aminodeoxychorismate/anthranilate synthase component II [Opitutales bacterium]|nr:aminodeoxychorismate/anthranilate synthase component II [Opitutales bacterium]
MILLIDNYDSFTYNLFQYLSTIDEDVMVVRNDRIDINRIALLAPDLIVLSPGPGGPDSAGICVEATRAFMGRLPILGICLGMQAIAVSQGAKVVRAREPMHGKTRSVVHEGNRLFQGLPSPLTVTRYHSLAVERHSLPDSLVVDAESEDGEIMALSHRTHPIWGVQFHPEALLTEYGMELLGAAVVLARRCQSTV